MPENHPAAKVSLSFAKLVATPTETAWSQAYNAGNLFVCLSLKVEEVTEDISLHSIGKDLFNVLQSEFFTLQEKNTASIKMAIQTSLENLPPHVQIDLTIAFFRDTTLFVFIAGSGKIILKRGTKVGTLLTKNDVYDGSSTSASGFIENSDTVILETGQFAQGISQETIVQALELALPNDIVEALSPEIHKQDNGAQAAIVISCQGILTKPEEDPEEPEEDRTLGSLYAEEPHHGNEPEQEHEHSNEQLHEREYEQASELQPESEHELDDSEEPMPQHHRKLKMPKLHFKFAPHHLNLNHRRKLFLNIALIIAVLLILSIFFTVKKYNDDKEKQIFQSVYPTAQQYYSEGKGLETVNASLSQNSYQKAENLLKNGETKLDKNSTYYQQVADLLSQVENAQQGTTSGQATNATATQAPAHSLLATEQTMSNGLAFGQDDNDVYMITNSAIATISKTDGSTKDIIKNNSDWAAPLAVVPYEGNIYVLDQKKGLLKYVQGGSGFGKDHYFTASAPDLSTAVGMAIDGSVWLLFKDGTISQYTKAVSNGLTITGLTKPLSNPTKIVTDITMGNMYVLDRGNSRIVEFDKNGKYQNAYDSSILANASDFDVSETDKTFLILSAGKVWKMSF